jgi:hypothetical protein
MQPIDVGIGDIGDLAGAELGAHRALDDAPVRIPTGSPPNQPLKRWS